jgi:hypothetical protein
MIGEFLKFTQQLDLAAKHLALARVLEAEQDEIQKLAEKHALNIPDRVALRRLGYRSAVIETYGALEDYVLDASSAYAASMHHLVPEYQNLARRIRDHHLALSLRVLEQRERSEWKGLVEPEGMLARLLGCMRTPHAYRLNEVVFREHTANFRSEVIQGHFTRLNVEVVQLLDLTAADDRLNQASPLSGLVKDTRGALDLLAERRNEIAHGTTDTDLLSHEILTALVESVRLYGGALHNALLDAMAHVVAEALPVFGEVERTFRRPTDGDGEIVGVRATGASLAVRANDWIVARRRDGTAKLVRTRTIEVGRVAVEEWRSDAAGGTEGGIWVERIVGAECSVCPLPASLRIALGLVARA